MNEIPRRNDILRMTPAEIAIQKAVQVVEQAGCHPLLTDAVILLDQARSKVADFVDRVPHETPYHDFLNLGYAGRDEVGGSDFAE